MENNKVKKMVGFVKNHKFVLLIILSAIIVYFSGLQNLRLIRDDQSNTLAFASLLDQHGFWGTIKLLISNEWMGGYFRVYFLAWIFQMIIVLFAGFNFIPFYVFILSLHTLSSVLIFKILQNFSRNDYLSLISALLFLVAPTATNSLFWLNNWFFVIPFFFFVFYIWLMLRPGKNRVLDLLVLTLTLMGAQFAGEQLIISIYLLGVAIGVYALLKKNLRKNLVFWVRLLIPQFAGVLSMLAYVKWVPKAVTYNVFQLKWVIIDNYLQGSYDRISSYLHINQYPYGYNELPMNNLGWFLLVCLLLATSYLLYQSIKGEEQLVKNSFKIVLINLIVLIGTFVVLVYGAVTGIRGMIEDRYLYVSVSFVLIPLPYLMYLIFRKTRVVSFFMSLLVFYLGGLTIYSLQVVWAAQKDLDERMWAQVMEKITPETKYIYTDSLEQAYLIPVKYSQAISDFQADWGVWGYLRQRGYNVEFLMHGMHYANQPNNVVSADFYHEYKPTEVEADKVLYTAFRHEDSFTGMLRGDLFVTNDLNEYLEYKKNEGIIIPSQPTNEMLSEN